MNKIISLDKITEIRQNGVLSQKLTAVTPSLMVWLILQNKPLGEYVKRFLVIPRVRPHHPITGFSTQNLQGVFQ